MFVGNIQEQEEGMFVGRKKELQFLEKYYGARKNNCIILYGRKGIGKTELIRQFIKGKDALYYQARECSEREQFFLLKREWKAKENLTDQDFDSLFHDAAGKQGGKRILIFDDFHKMVKNGGQILPALGKVWEEQEDSGSLMLILLSSSVQWVENHMVKELGEMARRITACRKLKEFSFLEMVSRFPKASVEECIQIYGILGGVPEYLEKWEDGLSVKENVINLFFSKEEIFSKEVENYLKSELRELSLYNTMLAALAEGKSKLNDIHDRTGFSRAKISVYLKNLIQMDVVEKVFSYDAGNYENVKKGLYTIREPFLYFWYRFCFPNLTRMEMLSGEENWRNLITRKMDAYMERFFISVCKEYLDWMNLYGKLPFSYKTCGSWYGKTGDLDIVATNEEGQSLVGRCKWSDQALSEDDLRELLVNMEMAGLESDYYFLFSKGGFTDSMEQKAKQMENIILTDMNRL